MRLAPAFALLFLSLGSAFAEPEGRYTADGSIGAKRLSGSLDVTRGPDGQIGLLRSYSDGRTWQASAPLRGRSLTVTLRDDLGLVGALRELSQRDTMRVDILFSDNGYQARYYQIDASGIEASVGEERGQKLSGDSARWQPSATLPQILEPRSGACLEGQRISISCSPDDSLVTIDGPAVFSAQGEIEITGPGEVRLRASHSGRDGPWTRLHSIELRLTEVAILDSEPILDAAAPRQLNNTLTAAAPLTAAQSRSQNLRMSVSFEADEDLVAPASLQLVGQGDSRLGLELQSNAVLQSFSRGESVMISSARPLSESVDIKAGAITWTLSHKHNPTRNLLAASRSELRVYALFAQPRRNIPWAPSPLLTVHHLEEACTWTRGARINLAPDRSPASINISKLLADNIRHYVHHKDFGASKPFSSYYWASTPAPKNYEILPAASQVRNGQRPVSPLFYPPFIPNRDIERYDNYARNYGWLVLDHLSYPGGRCNQQASLMADVLGTLGVKASVHFLQRIAIGPRSGRPMRQWFFAHDGGLPWNFHGILQVTLDDGQSWYYDTSFSPPPRRFNGNLATVEHTGGEFIRGWDLWQYDDTPWLEIVPNNDLPKDWIGAH